MGKKATAAKSKAQEVKDGADRQSDTVRDVDIVSECGVASPSSASSLQGEAGAPVSPLLVSGMLANLKYKGKQGNEQANTALETYRQLSQGQKRDIVRAYVQEGGAKNKGLAFSVKFTQNITDQQEVAHRTDEDCRSCKSPGKHR